MPCSWTKAALLAAALWIVNAGCAPGTGGDDTGDLAGEGEGEEGEGEGEGEGEDVRPGPDDPGPADPEECSEIAVEAAPAIAPADIIWVIDNSGSMDEEEARIRDNLNAFSQAIEDSGIDHHVVMITNVSHITVPPPLGGSDRFLAIDQDIDSNDALEKLLATFPLWRDFLRPGATKHFVAVTDDESDMSAGDFEAQVAAIPELGPDFLFHAVVAEDPPWNWNSPCFTLAADVGDTYIELQEDHGGVFYSLCQSDWTPLFDGLTASVVGNASLPCTYEIPPPPEGEELDWDAVNFLYTPEGGNAGAVPFVGAASECDDGPGWYYDDPAAPTEIRVCPATCAALESGQGQVDVAFGCATLLE